MCFLTRWICLFLFAIFIISSSISGQCPRLLSPVCGADGKSYDNACLAEFKSSVQCDGPCPCQEEVCACPKHISPVCGEDGNDYHNPCLAKCKTKVKCKGKCPCA
ncbi:four-domain proteases inhibitor isoform X2 [Eurytemora carolleeae]|uniref:four-domain proteases inhibitor isoform X2 n=1 Tax=Eurytemora carolleeae TaxID=1294199 RepID=UPI000C7935FA|nr:four-domain proteases inhibitor isoform X2 [Eurytemora carolleeae]|eukprot:XP_023344452.1 four-domain proteases inhibitor-like isoform X2 [Eurytemora affinis]